MAGNVVACAFGNHEHTYVYFSAPLLCYSALRRLVLLTVVWTFSHTLEVRFILPVHILLSSMLPQTSPHAMYIFPLFQWSQFIPPLPKFAFPPRARPSLPPPPLPRSFCASPHPHRCMCAMVHSLPWLIRTGDGKEEGERARGAQEGRTACFCVLICALWISPSNVVLFLGLSVCRINAVQ
jgi:hypothetical protein